jgi:hypothetical protein
MMNQPPCPLPLFSRRRFLQKVGTTYLAINSIPTNLAADVPPRAELLEAAKRGRRFLQGLFDPAVNLLPEYHGAKVYWLFHDNYLASKVLARDNRDLAHRIQKAIRGFGVDHSGKIEILFAEARHPLPFRQYDLQEVARIGSKVIKTEVVTETVLPDWQQYADLLFLAAIAETDRTKAHQHLTAGLKLWDGTGFKDQAGGEDHHYATYKLALSLIASSRLKVKPEPRSVIIERLLAMQAKDGGWITDYSSKREPLGRANVETTCLAILGLNTANET